MYVEVNMGHGRSGRIGVHEGDDLAALARNFARAFQLDRDHTLRLRDLLRQTYHDQMRDFAACGKSPRSCQGLAERTLTSVPAAGDPDALHHEMAAAWSATHAGRSGDDGGEGRSPRGQGAALPSSSQECGGFRRGDHNTVRNQFAPTTFDAWAEGSLSAVREGGA